MSVKRYEWVVCDEHACHCDVVESAEGDMVDYEDYAALESRCAALAAELNEIKVAVMARMKLHEEIRNAGRPPHTDFWHQSIYMADKRVDDSLSSTPNHDDFLAEVRAQGVEMFGASLPCPDLDSTIREFADELRKGVQS